MPQGIVENSRVTQAISGGEELGWSGRESPTSTSHPRVTVSIKLCLPKEHNHRLTAGQMRW